MGHIVDSDCVFRDTCADERGDLVGPFWPCSFCIDGQASVVDSPDRAHFAVGGVDECEVEDGRKKDSDDEDVKGRASVEGFRLFGRFGGGGEHWRSPGLSELKDYREKLEEYELGKKE